MQNIILIGMPGCGKTSIGKLLSKRLGMKFVDFDDDIIEVVNQKSCGKVLEELGEEKFLKMEEKLALDLKLENSILSTSGSVPLSKKAMDYLKTQGIVIYIDIPVENIEKRLHKMKVDRIVGMKNMTLREILEYRKNFYENSYHYKFSCKGDKTKHDTFNKFLIWFEKLNLNFKFKQMGKFIETRGNDGKKKEKVSFSEAILHPSASFGGLYVPELLPSLGLDFLEKHINSNYKDLAIDLLKEFNVDIDEKDLQDVVSLYDSFDDKNNPVPCVKVKDDLFALELYHGPTRAFKDMALQPFGALLSKLAQKQNKNFLVMIATSGDTGPAALSSLSNKKNIKGVCLYPDGGTSDVQRLQMVTNNAPNIKVLAVKGNFDDTQNTLKSLLKSENFNKKLKELNIELTAANSVNFGRIIFQIVFHIWAYLELVRKGEIKLGDEVEYIVPSGNFGDALGGYYARKMGVPISKILIASNENNILTDFVKTGKYDLRNREFKNTLAPAMDILISSNVERVLFEEFGAKRTKQLLENLAENKFFELNKEETKKIQKLFDANFATDEEIKQYIKKYVEENNYLMDPHTATCIKCYENNSNNQLKKVMFSTAEFTKFAPNILSALENSDKKYTDKEALEKISEKLNIKINKNISDLFEKEIVQKDVVEKKEIEEKVLDFLRK